MNTRSIASMTASALTLMLSAGIARAGDCGVWVHFPAPSPGTSFNILYDVAGTGPADVWAVGRADNIDGPSPRYRTLALHWDGAAWTQTPTPNPSVIFNFNELNGVVPLGPAAVLAVGTHNPDTGGPSQPLTLRYDGSSWSVASSPVVTGGASFTAITRVGSGPGQEIWAVGSRVNPEPPPAPFTRPMSARWTGDGWELVSVPSLGAAQRSGNILMGIAGTAPDDIWAVGRYKVEQLAPYQPSIYHYDGSQWSVALSAGPSVDDGLEAVAVVSRDFAVAVGRTYDYARQLTQPLIFQWDGTSWNQAVIPPLTEGSAELRAVAARGATDVWAAGTYADAAGFPRSFIMHFDGDSWSVEPGAQTDGGNEWFRGMAVVPGGDIWAVGQYYSGGEQKSLTERRCLSTSACRADLTGDGIVDFADYLEFLNRYDALDPSVDFTGDGLVDFADYLEFLNLYEQGC